MKIHGAVRDEAKESTEMIGAYGGRRWGEKLLEAPEDTQSIARHQIGRRLLRRGVMCKAGFPCVDNCVGLRSAATFGSL
jgi:hypothetical protein